MKAGLSKGSNSGAYSVAQADRAHYLPHANLIPNVCFHVILLPKWFTLPSTGYEADARDLRLEVPDWTRADCGG
jgi:hypothetical protein